MQSLKDFWDEMHTKREIYCSKYNEDSIELRHKWNKPTNLFNKWIEGID